MGQPGVERSQPPRAQGLDLDGDVGRTLAGNLLEGGDQSREGSLVGRRAHRRVERATLWARLDVDVRVERGHRRRGGQALGERGGERGKQREVEPNGRGRGRESLRRCRPARVAAHHRWQLGARSPVRRISIGSTTSSPASRVTRARAARLRSRSASDASVECSRAICPSSASASSSSRPRRRRSSSKAPPNETSARVSALAASNEPVRSIVSTCRRESSAARPLIPQSSASARSRTATAPSSIRTHSRRASGPDAGGDRQASSIELELLDSFFERAARSSAEGAKTPCASRSRLKRGLDTVTHSGCTSPRTKRARLEGDVDAGEIEERLAVGSQQRPALGSHDDRRDQTAPAQSQVAASNAQRIDRVGDPPLEPGRQRIQYDRERGVGDHDRRRHQQRDHQGAEDPPPSPPRRRGRVPRHGLG